MSILLRWLITAVAVYFLPEFISGISVSGVKTTALVAVCLVFIHLVIRPIVSILTLPINIITLGLFSVLLNGVFFWFVAQIISGITISTFTAAIIGALVISVLNWIIGRFAKKDE